MSHAGPEWPRSYAYEVEIQSSSIMQIGWATKNAQFAGTQGTTALLASDCLPCDSSVVCGGACACRLAGRVLCELSGVGDDGHAWAWDGCRKSIWNAKGGAAAILDDVAATWCDGDVLTFCVTFLSEAPSDPAADNIGAQANSEPSEAENKREPRFVLCDFSVLVNGQDVGISSQTSLEVRPPCPIMSWQPWGRRHIKTKFVVAGACRCRRTTRSIPHCRPSACSR